MRILLTNDDGILASGIQALMEAISEIGEVFIVAPDRERSATGHGITVHQPLRVEVVDFPQAKGWAVSGTPADCVKIAVEALLPAKPDLVIAGINLGSNLGTDVLYSGTVSAAIEGVISGIPSLAVSLDSHTLTADFSYAAKFIKKVAPLMTGKGLTPDTLLNINFPNLDEKDVKGVRVTRLGTRRYANVFEARQDPRGRTYYWMGGQVQDEPESINDPDIDIGAVRQGMVSVTPIHFDLTNYYIIDQIKKLSISK